MAHLKKIDSARTVIMVQVENEAGTWGAIRDYDTAAAMMGINDIHKRITKPKQ